MSIRTMMRTFAGAALVALATGAGGPAQAAVEWDFPLAWPLGNFHVSDAQEFADAVRKATGGEVDITVHPGGSLGFKGPEMLAAIRDGVVPIGDILLNQQVGEEPFLGIESVPYLASGYLEVRALQTFSRPIYNEIAWKHNQKILYMVPWPGANLYTKKEIKTLDDLKGLKIRTSNKATTDFYVRLEANPIQMPWGEVVPALSAGAIDGVTTSSASAVDGKFWEFLSHTNTFNDQSASNMVTVNLDAWKQLAREHQVAIERIAIRFEGKFWKFTMDQDEAKLAQLAENGMKITAPDAALKKELIERARPMWDEFIDNVPRAEWVIEAYRQMVGK